MKSGKSPSKLGCFDNLEKSPVFTEVGPAARYLWCGYNCRQLPVEKRRGSYCWFRLLMLPSLLFQNFMKLKGRSIQWHGLKFLNMMMVLSCIILFLVQPLNHYTMLSLWLAALQTTSLLDKKCLNLAGSLIIQILSMGEVASQEEWL